MDEAELSTLAMLVMMSLELGSSYVHVKEGRGWRRRSEGGLKSPAGLKMAGEGYMMACITVVNETNCWISWCCGGSGSTEGGREACRWGDFPLNCDKKKKKMWLET